MAYPLQPFSSSLPSYRQSLKPALLCLDGGGTRIFVQLQMLCELMHRLAWDLKLISSRPSVPQKCEIYPADCFNYIGAGGCGSIIAYFLAAGLSAQASLDKFMTLSPILSSARLHPSDSISSHDSTPFYCESLLELQLALDGCLPRHEQMEWQGDYIIDIPARTSVWIASGQNCNSGSTTRNGNLVRKGDPIRRTLLPLVLAEIEREMRGDQVSLDHTLEFLQAVCPVFSDCSLLLALGSGEVPRTSTRSPSPSSSPCLSSTTPSNEPSWLGAAVNLLSSVYNNSCAATTLSHSTKQQIPTISPAALAPSTLTREQSRALNGYIPTRAYGRSYIRLSPDLTTRSQGSLRPGLVSYSSLSSSPPSSPYSILGGDSQIAWPGDWQSQCFSEHRMLTASYCSKAETGTIMDRVVDVLGRREFPGTSSSETAHEDLDMNEKEKGCKWNALVFESAGYSY